MQCKQIQSTATAAGYQQQQQIEEWLLICVRRDLDDHAGRSDGSRLNSGPETPIDKR